MLSTKMLSTKTNRNYLVLQVVTEDVKSVREDDPSKVTKVKKVTFRMQKPVTISRHVLQS